MSYPLTASTSQQSSSSSLAGQYTATQFSFASTPKPFKNPHYTRHSAPGGPVVSIEATPSLMPQKRYCDITGLEAKYVDPRTLLRYHSPSIFELIRSPSFQPAVVQAYLALRGMGVVLR
ncbi:RHTO0S05e11056g2_1 [Rhodotorula toruloides]|uniref:RHTO0S05e11056g2_1 n=1 Tax=Rhodotorula toruloides TaxID=5286 RepID=A0A061AU23_RHOTO|nr:RHTO0S05e11056g2_1 [Rhodotorula toruloides]